MERNDATGDRVSGPASRLPSPRLIAAERELYAYQQPGVSEANVPEPMSGEELINDLYDFIRRRLPLVPAADPYREPLSQAAIGLGKLLGRPQLVAVPSSWQTRLG